MRDPSLARTFRGAGRVIVVKDVLYAKGKIFLRWLKFQRNGKIHEGKNSPSK
jgi:hypothetical protein